MFLHLGEDIVVLTKDIVTIIDMDGSTISKYTRELLRKGEENGCIYTISSFLPRTIIITSDKKIYLSPVSVSTLLKKQTCNL